MLPKVSIVIVNWNGRRFLEICLPSVLAQTYPNFDVTVVDNGSSDGSLDLIRAGFPTVRVIANQRNLGFSAGNNAGIRGSDGAYVATLNNDVRADPDWLAEAVDALNSDVAVGMVACKMLFYDRPNLINSTGISIDCAAIAWDRLGGHADDAHDCRRVEIFGPSAGAALYRRDMLEDVGLFDEDFFMYLEDVDLAWRARLSGWKCVFVPTARVLHVHSGSSVEGSAFKNYHLGRNKVWTTIKCYPSPQIFYYLPLILFYDLASLPYSIFVRGQLSSLLGRLVALGRLHQMLAKRRQIQRRKRVGWEEFRRLLTPLDSPLALLKRYRHLKKIAVKSPWLSGRRTS